MNFAEITAVLDQQFGGRIKEKKADALDPFVVVAPGDLVEVCRCLRDDPRLKFELLNCISGVDYLEPDPKKAPKAGKKAGAARDGSKAAKILDLLKRPEGGTLKELMKATGWQAHSVRGFLSGTVGKRMGLTIASAKSEDGERTYSVKA